MTAPAPRLTAGDMVKLKHYLIDNLARLLDGESIPPDRQREVISERLNGVYQQTRLALPEDVRAGLFKEVLDELLGYGPIQALLDDDEVSEIMVNGPDKVYIEKSGQLVKTPVRFEDDAHVTRVIERIVLPLGRRIDADNATVDARLPDGSRVNAVVPPVAIDGPSLTIRKFRKEKLSIEQLIQYGSLTQGMADFVRACVIARLNTVISGGTGTGKTTFLNALLKEVPETDRLIVIEDTPEVKLQHPNAVGLVAVGSELGESRIGVDELLRASLRMRPDRLMVGEIRGPEAFTFLRAVNTGHPGSLTTVHADSPQGALEQIAFMTLQAGLTLTRSDVIEYAKSVIDIVVQLSRVQGKRSVSQVAFFRR